MGSVHCVRCDITFPGLRQWSEHIDECWGPRAKYRPPRFRDKPEGSAPTVREPSFADAEFTEPETARWGSETEVDAIDSGLRTGRIKTEPADVVVTEENLFRKAWRWLTGK